MYLRSKRSRLCIAQTNMDLEELCANTNTTGKQDKSTTSELSEASFQDHLVCSGASGVCRASFHEMEDVSSIELATTPDEIQTGDAPKEFFDELELEDDLCKWFSNTSIAKSHLSSLLKVLKKYHPELPACAETLLKKQDSSDAIPITILSNGKLAYFGIVNQLRRILRDAHESVSQLTLLELTFNMDGVPLFNSSRMHIWPILCICHQLSMDPFVIAIFLGNEKPKPEEYLQQFVEELQSLLIDGVQDAGHCMDVKVRSFICDAPARSLIKGTIGHSGYSSCEFCTAEGEHYMGRIVFDELSGPLRTDESFRAQDDEQHHRSHSMLEAISQINMIIMFPLDYMHNTLLGCMRKWLFNLISGDPGKGKQPNAILKTISSRLCQIRHMIPSDFARLPRSLEELKMWKATELRSFLLYWGIPVLKGIIPRRLFLNFILLHTAIYILCDKVLYKENLEFCQEVLESHVKSCRELFGRQYIIFNVHNLLHLVQCCRWHGCLDSFSAFKFENFLGHLKRQINSGYLPLQQLVNRLTFMLPPRHLIVDNCVRVYSPHNNGPLPDMVGRAVHQYKVVQMNTQYLTLNRRNCFFSDCLGKLFKLENVISSADGSSSLVCRELLELTDVYDYPIKSSAIGILEWSGKVSDICLIPVTSFLKKYCMIELETRFLIPLI